MRCATAAAARARCRSWPSRPSPPGWPTKSRSSWRSSPPCSTCRPASEPCWCSATCSATAPRRWPTCSAAPKPRSRAPCSAPAPLPDSPRERHLAGRFAAAVEAGDIDAVLALLTRDAWLTMPPEPHEYQGLPAIAAFLHHRASLRGAPLRLVPTRANTQPAFGCYLPCPQAPIARPYGLIVLTLRDSQISAITWFSDTSVFPHFGLPRTLPQ